MIKQSSFNEYQNFGKYIDDVRRAKKVPYRVFEANGVSSRTFQRVVAGESDMAVSDLAIIVEILCLSPLEVNLEVENQSMTVQYRNKFVSAIQTQKFEEAERIYGLFKEYTTTTSVSLGKLYVLYMMQGMSLLHNPKTNITKAEALDNENKIIKQLNKSEIYTLFDLEFLAMQNLLGLQKMDFSLVKEILVITEFVIADYRTKNLLEDFFLHIVIANLQTRNVTNLFEIIKIINKLYSQNKDWFFLFLKKCALLIENQMINPKDEQFKENLLQLRYAFTVLFPNESFPRIEYFLDQLEINLIEDNKK
ncbi:hypothetical protein [Pseudolactococcus laudensis]|uniref:hypothetical protein n=1 Tax=Pseudolactococcus laudensis TaxID=1494461 RepID=UPI003F95F69A